MTGDKGGRRHRKSEAVGNFSGSDHAWFKRALGYLKADGPNEAFNKELNRDPYLLLHCVVSTIAPEPWNQSIECLPTAEERPTHDLLQWCLSQFGPPPTSSVALAAAVLCIYAANTRGAIAESAVKMARRKQKADAGREKHADATKLKRWAADEDAKDPKRSSLSAAKRASKLYLRAISDPGLQVLAKDLANPERVIRDHLLSLHKSG